jgi:hypothetical protein
VKAFSASYRSTPGFAGDMPTLGLTPRADPAEAAAGGPSRINHAPQFSLHSLPESELSLHSGSSQKTKAPPGEACLATRRRARREILALTALGVGYDKFGA